MSIEQFLNWIISNPEFAGIAMFLIGFLEAFFISGIVWPSVILLVFAVGLSEADIKLSYICLGAGLGAWIGDTTSYYCGLFFGPKFKNLEVLKKREDIFIRGENFFNKYGWVGILIGRLIPAIRPFIPFIAGISSMRQPIFLASSIFACFIWTIALAILILGLDSIMTLFT